MALLTQLCLPPFCVDNYIFQKTQLMAHLLLDSLSGISNLDNQTLMTVQHFLESSQPPATNEGADEEDVFQCGKCKQQFRSLTSFMNHKKEQCILKLSSECSVKTVLSNSNNLTTAGQNHMIIQQDATSNVIQLSDSDLLSLNIDPGLGASSHNIEMTSTEAQTLAVVTDSFASAQRQSAVEISKTVSSSNLLQNTINIPASLLSGSNMLTGTPLLFTTAPLNHNITTDFTIPQNILLNITNPMVCLPTTTSPSTRPPTKLNTLSILQPKPAAVNRESKNEKAMDTEIFIFPAMEEANTQELPEKKKKVILPVKTAIIDESSATDPKKSNLKLKCNFCDRSFTKNFDLQQHTRCHTGEKPFQCVVCGRAFAQKSNVKKHMQTHKVWPDGLAHTLPPPAAGSQYIHSKNDATSSVAVIEPFPSTSDAHGSRESVDSSYVCPYCPYNGKTYFELKSHMKSHKREKVYKCIQSSCGKMFSDLEPFLEHIQSHENEMTYRCHQCSITCASLNDLRLHQYNHTKATSSSSRSGQRYYRCQKCLNKYTTPAALEHHVATSTHHYPCTHCKKVFPCERYLRRHLLTHGSGLHICQFCEKTFKTANYLKVHLVIHTGEKPYACNLCKAAFNRRDKLKRHKLVHETVKRFKCPFRTHTGCPKEFNRPDKLKAHILTHSGIKPHQCSQCGRSFSRRAHLRAHMNGHNANTTTVETTATNANTSSAFVSTDITKNDYITLFDCQSCGSLFTAKEDLQKHHCDAVNKDSLSPMKKVSRIQPSNVRKVDFSEKRKNKMTNSGLSVSNLDDSNPLLANRDGSNDLIFNLSDGLDDNIEPTTQIEIVTTTSEICNVNSLPSIIAIDGIQFPVNLPILSNSVDHEDTETEKT